MSVVLIISCRCDGCGRVLKAGRRCSEQGIAVIRWKWWQKWARMARNGAPVPMIVERVRRPTQHFCATCADSNPSKK